VSDTNQKLWAKLADVMHAIGRVPKRGRNDFHGYDYATEADVVEAVRSELAMRKVILLPEISEERREIIGQTKAGRDVCLTTLDMTFQFLDGESGETIVKRWRGWGIDESDKGGYKALTGAEKYFLLKTFLLPTGDDPEASHVESAGRAPVQPPAAKATTKKQAEPPGAETVLEVKESQAGGSWGVRTNGGTYLTKDGGLAVSLENCRMRGIDVVISAGKPQKVGEKMVRLIDEFEEVIL
jgi:hypothetical protein